jgi:hypothetical protein
LTAAAGQDIMKRFFLVKKSEIADHVEELCPSDTMSVEILERNNAVNILSCFERRYLLYGR